jgi:hypothetical protein
MKAIEVTHELEETRTLTVRAPQLRKVVRVMFQARTNPDDRRTYIQLELMRNHGLTRCPSCDTQLSLDGYTRTRTAFSERETLSCKSCSTTYLLYERHCA